MMQKITVEKAQKIATKARLRPARVKGTDVLQFTRRGGVNFEILGWDDFATTLKTRRLAVYESGGFMKIMRN